jgi:hypothetical protein
VFSLCCQKRNLIKFLPSWKSFKDPHHKCSPPLPACPNRNPSLLALGLPSFTSPGRLLLRETQFTNLTAFAPGPCTAFCSIYLSWGLFLFPKRESQDHSACCVLMLWFLTFRRTDTVEVLCKL